MSIKFLSAACLAGNIPNITPTTVEITNDVTTDDAVITAGNGKNWEIIIARPAPIIKPSNPPKVVKITDSNKN